MRTRIVLIVFITSVLGWTAGYPPASAAENSATPAPMAAPAPTPTAAPIQPQVDNVYLLNSNGYFLWGDTIHVVLWGTPRGFATFDVAKVTYSVPMTEMSPGRYEGTLCVDETMHDDDTYLVAHLFYGQLHTSYRASVRIDIPGRH